MNDKHNKYFKFFFECLSVNNKKNMVSICCNEDGQMIFFNTDEWKQEITKEEF